MNSSSKNDSCDYLSVYPFFRENRLHSSSSVHDPSTYLTNRNVVSLSTYLLTLSLPITSTTLPERNLQTAKLITNCNKSSSDYYYVCLFGFQKKASILVMSLFAETGFAFFIIVKHIAKM